MPDQKPSLTPDGKAIIVPDNAPAPAPSAPTPTTSKMPENLKDVEFSIDDEPEAPTQKEQKKTSPQEIETESEEEFIDQSKQQKKPPLETKEQDETELTTELPEPPSKRENQIKIAEKEVQEDIPDGKRDYSIFPEDVAIALRNTPNKVFTPILKYAKEIASKKKRLEELETNVKSIQELGMPLNWHEHEAAFTLHPDFQEAQSLYNQARHEEGFYRQQLNLINNGEKFRTLMGYTEDGRAKYSEPQEATVEAAEEMRQKVFKASGLVNQFGGVMNNIAQNFKGRYQAALNIYSTAIEKYFPWVKNEKDPRHKHAEKFYSIVPREFVNQPGTRVAALIYAQLQTAIGQINSLKKQIETGKFEAEEDKKIEKSPGTTSLGGGTSNTPTLIRGIPQGKPGAYVPPPVFELDE